MHGFFQTPIAQAVLLLTALAVVLASAIYLVARIRSWLHQSPPESGSLLTNFRELHSKGELSDEEYRTIKCMLADRLQEEITNKVKEG
jgi:uncharacterized membrane protein